MAEGGEDIQMEGFDPPVDDDYEPEPDEDFENEQDMTWDPTYDEQTQQETSFTTQLNHLRTEMIKNKMDDFYEYIKEENGYTVTVKDPNNFYLDKKGNFFYRDKNYNVQLTRKNDPSTFLKLQTIQNRNGVEFIRRGLGIYDYDKKVSEKVNTALEKELRDKNLTEEERIAKVNDILISEGFEQEAREFNGFLKQMSTLNGNREIHKIRLNKLVSDWNEISEKLNDNTLPNEEKTKLNENKKNIDDLIDAEQSAIDAIDANLRKIGVEFNLTIKSILNSDRTLTEKIRALFKEQGVTIVSILTAISLAISTLIASVVAAVGGGATDIVPTPDPGPTPKPPPGQDGVKEWITRHLKNLANLLKKIGEKLLAALPGILGSIASWLFNLLSKGVGFLASHVWVTIVGVVALLLGYLQKHLK